MMHERHMQTRKAAKPGGPLNGISLRINTMHLYLFIYLIFLVKRPHTPLAKKIKFINNEGYTRRLRASECHRLLVQSLEENKLALDTT